MTVKDIIVYAFKLLGRQDAAEAVLNGQTLDKESAEKAETLLYCYNAVEDELARYYFPVTASQQISSPSGIYLFENFNKRPVKILSVKSGGKPVAYSVYNKHFECNASTVTVEYQYAPDKKELDGKSEYDGSPVDERLLAAGVLAEYCLIGGAVKSAEAWESRYREKIDTAQKKYRASAAIPPRRWV